MEVKRYVYKQTFTYKKLPPHHKIQAALEEHISLLHPSVSTLGLPDAPSLRDGVRAYRVFKLLNYNLFIKKLILSLVSVHESFQSPHPISFLANM